MVSALCLAKRVRLKRYYSIEKGGELWHVWSTVLNWDANYRG